MSIPVNINGVIIPYPQTGDIGWGSDATRFAEEVASVLGKIGQSQAPVNNDIIVSPGNLSVTSGDLSVGGNASVTGNITVNGNSNLGNGTSDTTAITGILNVDSGVLYVDPTTNKVGINDATPSVELDVNGSVAITGNTTVDGVIYADDNTTANTPVISFTGDTNTGIGRSAADTLDFITNGNSRFRIESTGQIKAVYESQVGTDYNTTLNNGYLCRAWVNFNGTGTVTIQASGNVSSITDNSTGNYTVNFTTALPDANYSVSSISAPAIGSSLGVGAWFVGIGVNGSGNVVTKTTSSLGIRSSDNSGGVTIDGSEINVMVFR